jgi:hypothetical protein
MSEPDAAIPDDADLLELLDPAEPGATVPEDADLLELLDTSEPDAAIPDDADLLELLEESNQAAVLSTLPVPGDEGSSLQGAMDNSGPEGEELAGPRKVDEEWEKAKEEMGENGELLLKAVADSTNDRYLTTWKVWMEYIHRRQGGEGSGPVQSQFSIFLLRQAANVKVDTVLGFIRYLGKAKPTGAGWETGRIASIIPHLRFFMTAVGGTLTDVTFLDHHSLDMARKALARIVGTQRAESGNSQTQSRTLPVVPVMVRRLRACVWNPDWGTKEAVRMNATYLAMVVMFNSGIRPSSVAPTKQTDHAIKARNVNVLVTLEGNVVIIKGIEQVREYLVEKLKVEDRKTVWATVTEVQLHAVTTKTNVLPEIQICRRSHMESTLLEDLLEWISYSEFLKPLDPLFTQYSRRGGRPGGQLDRWVMQPRVISAMIKTMAEEHGLDPDSFSCKSMRVALASVGKHLGLSDEEIRASAGWAKNSTSQWFYQKAVAHRGLLSAVGDEPETDGKGYGLQQLRQVQARVGARKAIPVGAVARAAAKGKRGRKRSHEEVGECVPNPGTEEVMHTRSARGRLLTKSQKLHAQG